MTTSSPGGIGTPPVFKLLAALTLLGVVSLHTGCCIIGAAAAHHRELDKDRRTRADVASLDQLQPGAVVTIKQTDTSAVTGRFLGFSKHLSEPPAATPAPSDQMILLRVASQQRSIPRARVEWVQRKSSPHVVLIGFGVGLAVDITIIYIIGHSLSGYGTLS